MGRYPLVEIIFFEILHTIIFYPTRRSIFRAFIFATMIYLAARIYQTLEVSEPLAAGYAVGFRIGLHLGSVVYLLWAEGSFPDHWRRVRDEVHVQADGLDNLPSNFPSVKKIWWMLDIAHNVRMVGWVQEPRGCLPPPPSPSRSKFLWKTFSTFLLNTILLKLLTLVFAQSPAFDPRVHAPTDGPEAYLSAVPLLRRVPYVLSVGLKIAAPFIVSHSLLSLVCVGIGQSSPTLWPDMWGSWGDAYTVRKLWGCVRWENISALLALTRRFFLDERGIKE